MSKWQKLRLGYCKNKNNAWEHNVGVLNKCCKCGLGITVPYNTITNTLLSEDTSNHP